MDWLDEVIEERKKTDKAFEAAWPEAEERVRLATLRKRSGLTQAQVAEIMGVSQPRVAEIERHPYRVSYGRVRRYLEAIGASLEVTAR